MSGFVRSFRVATIPRYVRRDAMGNGLVRVSVRSTEGHVDPNARNDGLRHVTGIPALSKTFVTGIHTILKGEQPRHIPFGLHNSVAQGVSDLPSIWMVGVAEVLQTCKPSARKPPFSSGPCLAAHHPPRVVRKRLHPFVRGIAMWIQECVWQPRFNQQRARAGFRINWIGLFLTI